MEDQHSRVNRENRDSYIYEPRFAEYMIALHHFQSMYGLLPGECPVYHPLAHPRLDHDSMFRPIAPPVPPQEASPHEHELCAAALAEYQSALNDYLTWHNADKVVCRDQHSVSPRALLLSFPPHKSRRDDGL